MRPISFFRVDGKMIFSSLYHHAVWSQIVGPDQLQSLFFHRASNRSQTSCSWWCGCVCPFLQSVFCRCHSEVSLDRESPTVTCFPGQCWISIWSCRIMRWRHAGTATSMYPCIYSSSDSDVQPLIAWKKTPPHDYTLHRPPPHHTSTVKYGLCVLGLECAYAWVYKAATRIWGCHLWFKVTPEFPPLCWDHRWEPYTCHCLKAPETSSIERGGTHKWLWIINSAKDIKKDIRIKEDIKTYLVHKNQQK